MAAVLEIKAGPRSGERLIIRSGETLTIGRDPARAKFALPQDTYMSGLHFSVECTPQGAVLHDHSRNGTFIGAKRVAEYALSSGEEIRAGQTSFSVRIVAEEKASAPPPAPPKPRFEPPPPPSPRPDPSIDRFSDQRSTAPSGSAAAGPVEQLRPQPRPVPQPPQPKREEARPSKPPAFTVGSWAFSLVPQGWTLKEDFGMEHAEKEGFPATVTATEEMIGANASLPPFVESQLSMLRQYLRAPKIEAAIPPQIPGAEEKASVDIRHSTKDGQIIFLRRLYARSGATVGTITLMSLDADFNSLRPAFDAIIGGVSFVVKTPA